MIQVDTTSHTGGDDPEKFRAFHKTLAELFPLVFSKLEKPKSTAICSFTGRAGLRKNPFCS